MKTLLLICIVLGSLFCCTIVVTAAQPTPDISEGPFYPPDDSPDVGNDLTVVPGAGAGPHGQKLLIRGRVTDLDRRPVAGATIVIWQTDQHGKYDHPFENRKRDDGSAIPLDPGFGYWGKTVTSQDGRYEFRTIVPRHYSIGSASRSTHVHFKVKHADFRTLTTEMHFAGDERIPDDPVIDGLTMRQHRMLAVTLTDPPPGADAAFRLGVFDIVLAPPAAPSVPADAWSGSITFPGGEPEEVRFDVGMHEGRITALSLYFAEEDKSYPASQLRWDGNDLKFSWRPNVEVECSLSPIEQGGYAGPCTDSHMSASLVMRPPA